MSSDGIAVAGFHWLPVLRRLSCAIFFNFSVSWCMRSRLLHLHSLAAVSAVPSARQQGSSVDPIQRLLRDG